MKKLLEKLLRYILSKIEDKTIEELLETPIEETINEIEWVVIQDTQDFIEEQLNPEELFKKLLLTSIDLLDNSNFTNKTNEIKIKNELTNILERI